MGRKYSLQVLWLFEDDLDQNLTGGKFRYESERGPFLTLIGVFEK